MDLKERIKTFSELGEILRDTLAGKPSEYTAGLLHLINTQHIKNPWFTSDNVMMAIKAIAEQLTPENLIRWTDSYPALKRKVKPIRVGVIMAGNIPLVGFHDFLSVLISGNSIIAKTSSKDADLILYIRDILTGLNPGFKSKINFTDGPLSGFDAVIATGSDNSSRYFEYYFGRYPNIIRKNRNSIAIIEGNESAADLEALGTDVFSYFGLGCRNVSKLYVPEGFDFSMLIKSWNRFSRMISQKKYGNNYDFSKAVYLVNKEKFIDTGFVLLKEDQRLSSPVAVLHYQYFSSPEEVKRETDEMKERIQCIVGSGFIPFGKTQSPALWDYADGTDTIDFLVKKK